MPHYSAMLFGFKGPDAIWDNAQSLGISFFDEYEEKTVTSKEDMLEVLEKGGLVIEIPDSIDSKIDNLFIEAVNGLDGYAYKGIKTDEWGFQTHHIETPFGMRESSGLTLDLAFDDNECGDSPEDAVLGFFLTSRYIPAFLDLEQEHGGMKKINSKHILYIQSLITKEFPTFSNADMYVHELFA